MSSPLAPSQQLVTASDEAVDRIAKVLGLGNRVKSFSIDVEADEVVKVYCTRYLSKEEVDKIADIVEEEFRNGVVEVDAQYYVNGKSVTEDQQEPTENW
jgi:hypothetical protein